MNQGLSCTGWAELGTRGDRVRPSRPGAPEVCVIVPTRDEAANVAPLVRRLAAGLTGVAALIVFVDDSTDDTPAQVLRVAADAVVPVRLIHRDPGERAGGLGSAVLAGLSVASAAGAAWAVVMDGDLQHPPELVPRLIDRGATEEADLVVASRYCDGGSTASLADTGRVLVSGGATRMTRLAFPRRMSACTDPMSGFFAVRLASIDLDRLRPRGFKVLLEIIARSPRLRVAEVPFRFAARAGGESKASWREGLLWARRLASLRVASAFGRHSGRFAALAGFAAVGATGMAVNSLALWALVSVLGVALVPAVVLATQVSTGWNFVLTDTLVFRGVKTRPTWLRLGGFALINNAVLLLRLPLLSWLVFQAGIHYVTANVLTLLAAFTGRFLIADLFLFATRRTMSTINRTRENPMPDLPSAPAVGRLRRLDPAATLPVRHGPTDQVVDLRPAGPSRVRVTDADLRWRYDLHGLVTIGSVARLSELDGFAAPDAQGPFDIEIRGGRLSRPMMRPRARVTQFVAVPAVSYEEHTARLGTDFLIEMSEGITVTVGPMLTASPHVLYTNVIEALLRFVLVARGRVLLHSACLDLDGQGVMLSARTDTGKTGTVLRLLREKGGGFLSDDMTILDSDGIAMSFPKPMTISQHTLRAVEAGDLTHAEWRRLRVQSRLHSKQGRGIGCRLGELNVPIMCLNALTQWVVPPPKYGVERLVPCRLQARVAVGELFIIERGHPSVDPIGPDDLIDELIENTDDAYQFPPFRYFAPALVIDGFDYEQLRATERRILTQAMRRVRARRLVSADFDWADRIPALTDC